MKYCLNSRQPLAILSTADEIFVEYRDHKSVPTLLERYRKKIILSLIGAESIDWEEIKMFKRMARSGFAVICGSVQEANTAKSYEIPFGLNAEITNAWDMQGVRDLGASIAYIGIPLFFQLGAISDKEEYPIEYRLDPTYAFNNILPHAHNSFAGQFIRPEDIESYEGLIDVFEFPNGDEKTKTIYNIYKNTRRWDTNLQLLIPDLEEPAINRMISPKFAERRLNCGQKCMTGNPCRLCLTELKLANVKEIENAEH